MKRICMVSLVLIAAGGVHADEAAKPDVNKVIADIASVGPDALLARVKELKSAEQQLQSQATDLRKQADQKVAEAAVLRERIAAVEKFTQELAASVAPPPAPAAPAATPAAAPAPAPAPTPPPAPAEGQM